MQVPLCDECDTVMTLWWLSVAQAEALHWRSCGLVESIFCCLWSSQWLNLLYNYAHCIQYMQVPLCDACDTVITLWWLSVAHAEALHWRSCGLVESIICCLWSSQWLVCVRLAALSPAVKERLPRALLDLQPQLKAVGTLLTTVCLHHGLHRAVNDLVALHTAAVDGDGLFLLTQRLQKHKLMKLTKLEELVAHVILFKASGTVCWFQKSTKSAVTDRMWRLI